MTAEYFYDDWEPIIGLEVHVQLNTLSKLFSPAPNKFGSEPNTNIGIIDTGQPGSLPLLNKEAVYKAVMLGCAINSQIPLLSKFDRKSYFYPDSPRNFQITQFDQPILIGGSVTADVDGKTKSFAIEHAHLEDDSGMLKHFSSFTGVDYNRAGVPLIEIVSAPCMYGPKDASAYAQALRAILQYINVSDCNMEEGGLRFDINVSVRKKGESHLRNKTEIKNLNSFTYMEMAIESEIRRQIHAYTDSPHKNPDTVITSQTMRFDIENKKTIPMRSKEGAPDYRYFPEPDLPPIVLTQEYIDTVKKNMPELPHARFERYTNDLHLTPYSASVLINNKQLADYFEKALAICPHARALCNWITVEFVGRIKETGISLHNFGIPPQHIAELVNLIDQEKITGRMAKEIADIMVESVDKSPRVIISENPKFRPITDTSTLDPIIDQVLASHPQSIVDYKAGKDKAFNFLVGQIMKQCQGKASPPLVKKLLEEKISEPPL